MLQFQVSEFFGVSVKLHGMAMVNESGLTIAFHEPDEAKRALEIDVKSFSISWANLERLTTDLGILGDRLLITVRAVEPIGKFPGLEDRQLVLETRRSDRNTLHDFVDLIDDYRSGRRKDRVEEKLDDIRDFLYGN